MVVSEGCSGTMTCLRVAAGVRRVVAVRSVVGLSLGVTRFDIRFRSGFSAGSFGTPAHRQLCIRGGGVLVGVGRVVVGGQCSRVSSNALVSLDGAGRRLGASVVLLGSVSRGRMRGVQVLKRVNKSVHCLVFSVE